MAKAKKKKCICKMIDFGLWKTNGHLWDCQNKKVSKSRMANMYFECRECHEKITIRKSEDQDKKKLKIIAERHFREKHNEELIDHELITIN